MQFPPELIRALKNSTRVVALTGAGVSAATPTVGLAPAHGCRLSG